MKQDLFTPVITDISIIRYFKDGFYLFRFNSVKGCYELDHKLDNYDPVYFPLSLVSL